MTCSFRSHRARRSSAPMKRLLVVFAKNHKAHKANAVHKRILSSSPSGNVGAGLLEWGVMELEVIEPTILGIPRKEFVVAAFFDNFALCQDDNPIRTLNSRESVGNDQDRPADHQQLNSSLNEALGFSIE